METSTTLFISLVFILLGISCSNDIDLTSDWKDVPIVYGILSRTDSVHYIRVEKAFLDEEKSALETAKISDSLYYPNAVVQIKKLNSNEAPLVFQEVDAAQEGYPREDGLFATAPNIIYKLEMPSGTFLEAETDYELLVDRGDNFLLVTSETTVISDINITAPKIAELSTPFNWGDYDWQLTIRWRAKVPTAFFDVVFYIHLEEFDIDDSLEPKPVVLEWVVKRNQLARSASSNGIISMETSVSAENFYRFIAAKLESQPEVFRKFKSMDLMIRSGGSEFLEYIQLRQANFGITSSQVIPEYSNLSSGIGLFSSKNKIVLEGYQVNSSTIDSLIDGMHTKDLNFRW